MNLDSLHLFGFTDSEPIPGTRTYRVRCHSCEATVINGTPCHESGCTEAKHECHGCWNIIPVSQRYCADCL